MILCVDSDSSSLATTRQALSEAGLDADGATSIDGADRVLDDEEIECLITEYDLDDGTGLELVTDARERAPDASCILFTDTSLDEIPTAAFDDVVAEYLRKDGHEARSDLVELVEHHLAVQPQTAYPLPENETARVAALARYANDPAVLVESMDRITELATALFDVNSAGVGLIDAHEERFLSCYGASFDTLPREETICTYAILDPDVTVIEDVATDPRFSDNEGLAAADIRFYAGAPMVTEDGQAIGTLCVHDDEPRPFSERDRDLLSLLAAQAMEQLELRRRLRAAEGGERDD